MLFISISELYKNDIPYIVFRDLLFKNSSVTFPRSRGSCGFGLSVLKNIQIYFRYVGFYKILPNCILKWLYQSTL